MLSLDSIPRGFELCSTSYTNDSGHRSAWRCAVSRRRADRCGRTPASSRRRLQLVAASEDSEDSDISVYNRPALDLVKGPSGDPDLIRRTISLADAHNGNWAKDFEEFGDWQDFWNDGSTMFEDPALDDTWDGLTFGSARNTELLIKAHSAMARNFRDPEWIAKHPNFISNPPVPSLKRYQPQIPDPELVPHRDWDEWALRAWVEKRRLKEKTDAAWRKRQDEIGRFSILNVSEENDSRLELGWTTTPRTWNHEEIWDLILNGGQNAHPDDVKSVKIQDPQGKSDYFVEGVHYIPDTEEYLAEIGHWWEDETEPDLEHEVSLASEFSDLDVDGSGLADREGTSVADINNEDDNADDETAQLGRYFGSED